MRQKFSLIAILFLAISIVLVGCKPEEEDKPDPDPKVFSVLGSWVDGGDSVYTITDNTKTKLGFGFTKGTKPNAFITSPAITENLSTYKTLVITLEGSGSVMVELVNKSGTVKKVSLNVPSNGGTYQWNLNNDSAFLGTLDKVRITAAPGKENSTGTVAFTSLLFKEVVATGFIIASDYNDIVENVHEYNGAAGDFHFNSKWHRNNEAEEVYNITTSGTKTLVDVTKGAGNEWSVMLVRIKGDFSRFNYAVAKVKGDAGKQILFKIRDNPQAELKFTLTGEEQYLYYDFSNWSDAEKKALDRVMLFGLPGSASGSMKFEILDTYLTDTFDTGITKNEYNGTDNEFSLGYFYDGGDGVYEVEALAAKTDTIVTYEKEEKQEYSPLISYIEGDVSKFDQLTFVATGAAGKTAMVKLEATGKNYEFPIEFDGSKQTFDINLFGKLTKEQRTGINKVVIFAEPGTIDVSGEFTIHSLTFKVEGLSVNKDYVDGGDAAYTFTENTDGSVLITYNKLADKGWASFSRPLATEVYNAITVTLQGTIGRKVLVKINNSKEKWVEFIDENPLTVTLTLEEFELEEFTELRFFASGGVAPEEGTFTILDASFINIDLTPKLPVEIGVEVDVNKGWIDSEDTGFYTIEYVDGKTVVTYDKPAGDHKYRAVKTVFTDILTNHNTLTMTVKGDTGVMAIFKAANGSEAKIVFDGTEQTIRLRFPTTPTEILVFVEYETITAVNGSYEILSAKVTTEAHVVEADHWAKPNPDNDAVYTITMAELTKVVTVAFNKDATKAWAFIRMDFGLPLFYSDTITMVVKGTSGQKIMIKPNDLGAFEFLHTFDGTEETLVIPYVGNLDKVILFAEPDNKVSVSGSFEIISTTFSYEGNPYKVTSYKENDAGTYTFTNVAGAIKVDYTKVAGQHWVFFSHNFAPRALPLEDYNTITLVITGTAGKKILVKPNDAFEKEVIFDGTEQTITISIASLTVPLSRILLFAEHNTESVTGSFTIKSLTVSKVE